MNSFLTGLVAGLSLILTCGLGAAPVSVAPSRIIFLQGEAVRVVQQVPAPPLAVASDAIILEFGALPATSDIAALRLNLAFGERQSAQTALAVDVFLVGDGEGPIFNRRGDENRFLGSRTIRFRDTGATADAYLESRGHESAFRRPFRLMVVPVGSSGSPVSVTLTAAPSLDVALGPYFQPEISGTRQLLWEGNEVTGEPVVFLADGKGIARARLLHAPQSIEAVISYAEGHRFEQNKDWVLDPDGSLRVVTGSALPVITSDDLHPAIAPPGARLYPAADGRNIVYAEGWNFARTLWVTYRHRETWTGPYPEFADARMPRTIAKLRQREPLKVVFYGDSITAGASASVQTMEAPYQRTWPDTVVKMLREVYRGPIISRNRALGATRSDWGAAHAPTLVAPELADLCVIAFGMNDRGGVTPGAFEANIRAIMAAVRKTKPEAEFILVSSMLNNPEWSSSEPLWEYRAVLNRLSAPGVVVADITAVHHELLRRKDYVAMSGNNLNHPNDYLVQWYAQFIASMLIPPAMRSAAL